MAKVESAGELKVHSVPQMRLLFVKLKHIGDTLLLTPTLVAAKTAYPDASIWVAARKGCEDVLAGCSAVDRVVTSAPPEASNRSAINWLNDFRLLCELRRQHFDYAFELGEGDRGRWLAGVSGAKVRGLTVASQPLNGWWRWWFNASSARLLQNCHRVERDFMIVNDILPLKTDTPPALAFERSRTRPWAPAAALSDFILIHPGTRWLRKRWPVEKWIELCRDLLKVTSHVIISAGPDAEEIDTARQVQQALGDRALNSAGQLSWPQLAGLLYRARMFVGVDTAAMHLAAACQTPIVALFGPSVESEWRPWHASHIIVTPDLDVNHPEVTKPRGIPQARKINDITVPQALAACEHMLRQRPKS